jgi:hypothetical protein
MARNGGPERRRCADRDRIKPASGLALGRGDRLHFERASLRVGIPDPAPKAVEQCRRRRRAGRHSTSTSKAKSGRRRAVTRDSIGHRRSNQRISLPRERVSGRGASSTLLPPNANAIASSATSRRGPPPNTPAGEAPRPAWVAQTARMATTRARQTQPL